MKNAGVGVSCCVGMSLLMVVTSARAEAPRASLPPAAQPDQTESLFYEFEDDALNALGNDAQGMILRVRPGAARVVLLRPRVQFVSELLQSIEAL